MAMKPAGQVYWAIQSQRCDSKMRPAPPEPCSYPAEDDHQRAEPDHQPEAEEGDQHRRAVLHGEVLQARE
jgi:hypothetical protein